MLYPKEIPRQGSGRRFYLSFILCFYLLLAGGRALAQEKFSPELRWQSIESKPFVVHHLHTQKKMAEVFLQYLQEAYVRLSQGLYWKLQEPLHVVLRGDSDQYDGYAEVFPSNRLVLHAAPFFTHSSLVGV